MKIGIQKQKLPDLVVGRVAMKDAADVETILKEKMIRPVKGHERTMKQILEGFVSLLKPSMPFKNLSKSFGSALKGLQDTCKALLQAFDASICPQGPMTSS
jgi:hypothetical protein